MNPGSPPPRLRSSGSADLTDRLETDGYCEIDLLSPDECVRTLGAYESLGIRNPRRFLASHAALKPEPRRRVDATVRDVAEPALASLLPGQSLLAAALLVKGPRCGPVPYHVDLTFGDERQYRSYVCWVALTDATLGNGEIHVVPGSHRWSSGPRPGGPTGMVTEGLQEELASRAVPVPLRAGQAIIWDSALVHGSGPHLGADDRVAASFAFQDALSPWWYFHKDRSGEVEGFEIDNQFFFSTAPFIDRPTGYPQVALWKRPIEPSDLLEHLLVSTDLGGGQVEA